jgi:hypothetical protein
MRQLSKLSIAVLCALGITAVGAQTVQRDGKEVKPAQTRAPVQTAQAQAGGAAAGGAAGGVAAGGAVAGGTIGFISLGVVAATAATANSGDAAVTHNP